MTYHFPSVMAKSTLNLAGLKRIKNTQSHHHCFRCSESTQTLMGHTAGVSKPAFLKFRMSVLNRLEKFPRSFHYHFIMLLQTWKVSTIMTQRKKQTSDMIFIKMSTAFTKGTKL